MKNNHFPDVTNILVLEFLNTEIISYGSKKELINETNDLTDWLSYLSHKEIINSNLFNDKDFSNNDIIKLKEVRSYIRNIIDLYIESNILNDSFIDYLELKISDAPITYKLLNGCLIAKPVGKSIDNLISLIALDALKLIANEELQYIRKCANPECILLFFDKTGRKKWCSMKICGNRNKVKRYNYKHNKTT